MLIGFPSLIRELEKAEKRWAGDALGDLILTAPLPSDSAGKNRGVLARYRYLGISKKTQNPDASAKLLQYIMSEVGSAKSLEAFPLLLSPKRSLVNTQWTTPLSDVFARTRLDAFIPALQDDIFFFQYDIKGEYTRILRDYIDRNEKVDINNLIKTIQNDISCLVETRENGAVSEKCSGSNEW
jgi:ABC-type glycerol-3-phosphate transport system substrate-binding protein